MALEIYDTLARRKREFIPIEAGKVAMYACGITVYDECHMGHAFQAVVFDLIRRYLEFKGYAVTYVRNFTDIDDKIISRAREAGLGALELSARFADETRRDLELIKTSTASFEPKVSEHIGDIIGFVSALIDVGSAYESGDGDVWFSVQSFPSYGKLSNRRVEDMISEEKGEKRHRADFCLWKSAKSGEHSWPSPWGEGRPGWHIECSAMARVYLGDSFDIHGGGHDLVFPHHENEIAQSESLTGKKLANYWIHNGLVMIGGQKMSKSLGNFVTVKDALSRHHADSIRFMILSSTYSNNVDFSESNLEAADKRVQYFYSSLAKMDLASVQSVEAGRDLLPELSGGMARETEECLDDDFNWPKTLARFSDWFKAINTTLDDRKATLGDKAATARSFRAAFRVPAGLLRIFDEEPRAALASMRALYLRTIGKEASEIEALLAQRSAARTARDFAKADGIRDQLAGLGIRILDSVEGSGWEIGA